MKSLGWVVVISLCAGWQWEHPSPHGAVIEAKADRGGVSIAVGERGAIMKRAGGSWRSLESGVGGDLHAIVAIGTTGADGAWIVVGDGGAILRSKDGEKFEIRPSGSKATLVAVAATTSQILALADDGSILRSTDGGETFGSLTGAMGIGMGSMATAIMIAPKGVVIGGTEGIARADDAAGRFAVVTHEPIESIAIAADGTVTAIARARVVYPSTMICNACVDAQYETSAEYRSADTKTWQRRTTSDPATTSRAWGPPVAPTPPATPPRGASMGGHAVGPPTIQPSWGRAFARATATAAPPVPLFAIAATPNGRMIAVGMEATVMARDAAKSSWSTIDVPVGHSQRFNAVAALDAKRVVIVGDRGVILVSTDGAKTFSHRATDKLVDLTAVWGAGDDVFAAGRETLVRSRDGGTSWETIATKLSEVYGMWGAGTDLFAVGSGVFRSTDRGTTWTKLVDDGRFADVFGIGTDLFVVGSRGRFSQSTDRGATWTTRASGTTADLANIWGMGNDLWAVGGDSNEGVVVRSRDRGKTWHDELVPTKAPMFGVAGTATSVVVLGGGGAILRGVP